MSIEKDLSRIADALETIATFTKPAAKPEYPSNPGQVGQDVPAAIARTAAAVARTGKGKATAAAAVSAPGETAPTMDNLIDALRDLVNVKGAPVAKGVLAEFGASKVSDLNAGDYSAVFERMKEEKGA